MKKTIKVKNCQACPFVINDNEFGFWGCNISKGITYSMKTWEELPGNKVHDKCPLKNNSYKIKLK